ncbi:MAG: ABC transporter permease [Thermodesulfovibrionales bacterium]
MSKVLYIALAIIIASSIIAPSISPHDPEEINLEAIKMPPSLNHPFGTDNKGRDILSRVLYGGRISLSVALIAAIFSISIGLFIGLVAGYTGGWVDTALMALTDFVLSFPALLLAIGISIIMPPGIYTSMIAISATGWASFARLIRGYILSIKELPYIEAAKAIGCNDWRIIFSHIVPQCIPLSLVIAGLKLGGFILTEASLSFLGLGVQPPTPSWGSMISSSRVFILSAPWTVIFPGLAISITAICFNLIGDILRERYGFNKIQA